MTASTGTAPGALLRRQGLAGPESATLAALERVLRRAAGAAAPRDAARAQLPAPLPPASAFPEGRLSPRLLLLLTRALDTRQGMRVELVGEPLAALAAVLTELRQERRPALVTLRTADAERATLTLDRLVATERRAGVVIGERRGSDETADRLLVWEKRPGAVPATRLASGVVFRVETHGAKPRFLQETHAGGRTVTMDLSGVDPARLGERPARPEPSRRGGHRLGETVPLRRLLLVERMQENAWRGRATSRVEAGVALAVKRLFHEAPRPPAGTPEHALARLLLHLGYLEQVTATRTGAEAMYRECLAACETAEGWTFLGWALAQQGQLVAATTACESAIETDPTLGNPYNDLGAYRLSEGKRGEAKTWFERATRAERYMAPHYPYTNLARIHLEEGDLDAAREAAEEALAHMPGYQPAERLLRMLGDRGGKGTR